MALSRLSFVKLLELALTLACMGMHYKTYQEGDAHTVMLVNGTFVGFTIILIGLFAGYMMSTPINKRIDIFFSLVGCAMFIASGVLIIQYWNESWTTTLHRSFNTESKNLGITKGSLAIVNGIVFFVDVIFTFRD